MQGTQFQMNLSVKVAISQALLSLSLSLTTSSSLPPSLPPFRPPSLFPFLQAKWRKIFSPKASFKQSDFYIFAQRSEYSIRGIIGSCAVLGRAYGCKAALEEFTFREKMDLIKGLLKNVVYQEDLHLLENLRS